MGRLGSEKTGILLIDKPEKMTSAKVVAIIKRLTGSKKAGHTGTLDPLATGLLVCCLNQATKLAQFLLTGEKTYQATLRLGVTTDTQDATGKILDRKDFFHISKNDIEAGFREFIGSIQQRPPIYSAVKHQGKPLYHYARKGEPVAKPPRTVVISALTIKKIELPDVYFSVTCSAGTYIRTLCADLGKAFGCGGHLAALRRTASCGFSVGCALKPKALETLAAEGVWDARLVLPVDALPDMPTHQASGVLREKIRYGRPLDLTDGIRVTGEKMKIIDTDRKLLAVIDRNYKYCCVFPEGI